MKVVPASEMARVERAAIEDGCSEEQFMEEAGRGVAEEVENLCQTSGREWHTVLLCGKGNNGGDAYVAGCYLLQQGYEVRAFQLAPIDESSPLCREHHERFLRTGGEVVHVVDESEIGFGDDAVIVDGIFGTGFRGAADGLYAAAIGRANASDLPIVAIDIPSGVNGDSGEVAGVAIEATLTLYLGLPKTGFFLGDGWDCVGGLARVDFGLQQSYIDDAKPDLLLLEHDIAAELVPPVRRSRHKYQAGYVVGVAGSPDMPGAAILASFAALRSGAGMMRLLHPPGMEPHKLGMPAEVLVESWEGADETILRANAVFVGPGLGKSDEARNVLHHTLDGLECPCVIDADGLNLLSEEAEIRFPRQAIITPHAGEMERLLGCGRLERRELIERAQRFVDEKRVICVLKGAPTVVLMPEPLSVPWVIPTGNPGMATAGCGDVLTGILAALLAQGMRPGEAALLGAYLHGLAGDFAAAELTAYSLVASDLIDSLPSAFLALS